VQKTQPQRASSAERPRAAGNRKKGGPRSARPTSSNSSTSSQNANSIFAGLPYEEDVEVAVTTAESILGKSGRILSEGKFILKDAHLTNPKYGILWYGDLDLKSDDLKKVQHVAQALKISIFVKNESMKHYQGDRPGSNFATMAASDLVVEESGEIKKNRYP
jgi:hypothetical protein